MDYLVEMATLATGSSNRNFSEIILTGLRLLKTRKKKASKRASKQRRRGASKALKVESTRCELRRIPKLLTSFSVLISTFRRLGTF